MGDGDEGGRGRWVGRRGGGGVRGRESIRFLAPWRGGGGPPTGLKFGKVHVASAHGRARSGLHHVRFLTSGTMGLLGLPSGECSEKVITLWQRCLRNIASTTLHFFLTRACTSFPLVVDLSSPLPRTHYPSLLRSLLCSFASSSMSRSVPRSPGGSATSPARLARRPTPGSGTRHPGTARQSCPSQWSSSAGSAAPPGRCLRLSTERAASTGGCGRARGAPPPSASEPHGPTSRLRSSSRPPRRPSWRWEGARCQRSAGLPASAAVRRGLMALDLLAAARRCAAVLGEAGGESCAEGEDVERPLVACSV